jgi:hypothetical protein
VKLNGVQIVILLDNFVGSPTYGAKPTCPIISYLENLKSPGNFTAGVSL